MVIDSASCHWKSVIDLADHLTLIEYLWHSFLQITLGIQHVMQYDLVQIGISNIHSFQVIVCFTKIKIKLDTHAHTIIRLGNIVLFCLFVSYP